MAERALTGYRLVEILYGETLQSIAARELGDASRWVDLVAINALVYPYLTGDAGEASDRVKLYGEMIRVPSATRQVSAATDPDAVFGVDLLLQGGELVAVGGDLALVSGRLNLRQAIRHRIITPLGDLLFHLAYGNGAHRLKGRGNTPTANQLAAQYVKNALEADQRIDSVIESRADVSGDVIAAQATVRPVAGAVLDVSIEG